MNKKVAKVGECLAIAEQENITAITASFHSGLGQMLIDAASAGNNACCLLLIQAGAPIDYLTENYNGDHNVCLKTYMLGLHIKYPNKKIDHDEELYKISQREVAHCEQCLWYELAHPKVDDVEQAYRHLFRRAVTPLSKAVELHNNECVRTLVQRGASYEIDLGCDLQNSHLTAVHKAIRANNPGALHIFIEDDLLDVNNHLVLSNDIIQQAQPACLAILLKAGLLVDQLPEHVPLAIAAGSRGSEVPSDHRETKPLSLKYMCRDVIRKQLLHASDWNLFVHSTPDNLPLPRRLCQYLVCDFDLDNVA